MARQLRPSRGHLLLPREDLRRSIHLPLSCFRGGGDFFRATVIARKKHVSRYLDNFKNNLNFGFEGYAFLLLKEIPDIILENERRRMKGIGRVNRIVPITRALCLFFFFSLGGGGGRADLRGYCDRGRAQATTDEYIL